MNTRTLLTTLAAVTLILGSSSAALAWHGGHNGGGNGYGYNCYGNGNSNGGYNCYYGNGNGGVALTPEKQQAINSIVTESNTRIQPLMQQYQAKRMELDALAGNPSVKPEAISKLATEIAALQGQIRTEMDARNAKISAEGGMPAMGNNMGMGRGMGRHGGGHRGMGNCWN